MGNGLFGDLDIDEIADDPFAIEEGYYQFIVTKLKWDTFEPNDGSGNIYHNVTYWQNIDQPDSPYHNKPVQQRFNRYPDLTRAALEEMDPKDKQAVRDAMSRHKQYLRGLGLSEEDMKACGESEEANLEAVLGRMFTARYKETTSEKKNDKGEVYRYKNLQNMKPVDESAEPADTSDMGGFQF